MNKTLIEELRALIMECKVDHNFYTPEERFDEILSRHAEPKEEGLREDSLEAWENEAEAFYKATGYLRPGKDPGIIEDEGYRERRDKAWKIWSAGWCYRNDHPTPDKAVEPLAKLNAVLQCTTTEALLVELEKRRKCMVCKRNGSTKCDRCLWNGIYKAVCYRDNDHFKGEE